MRTNVIEARLARFIVNMEQTMEMHHRLSTEHMEGLVKLIRECKGAVSSLLPPHPVSSLLIPIIAEMSATTVLMEDRYRLHEVSRPCRLLCLLCLPPPGPITPAHIATELAGNAM